MTDNGEDLEFIIDDDVDLFMCHFILIKRLESIETNLNFEHAYENSMKDPKKTDILNGVSKFLEVILTELTEYLRDPRPTKKLYMRLYCSYSRSKSIYNERHQLLPQPNAKSYRLIRNVRRCLIFIFILLMFYEGLIFDLEGICRYLHYLLKYMFNNLNDLSDKEFHNTLSDIVRMLEIPDSFCSVLIIKKTEIVGYWATYN